MGRKIKSTADWFKHDKDMRHDPRVKAVRRKYGNDGYGVYNMLLETLTDSNGFIIEYTPLNIELMAGDFDLESELFDKIVKYMVLVGLFILDGEELYSETMMERFDSLIRKRERDRGGVSADDNAISADDNPQKEAFPPLKYPKSRVEKKEYSEFATFVSKEVLDQSITNGYSKTYQPSAINSGAKVIDQLVLEFIKAGMTEKLAHVEISGAIGFAIHNTDDSSGFCWAKNFRSCAGLKKKGKNGERKFDNIYASYVFSKKKTSQKTTTYREI